MFGLSFAFTNANTYREFGWTSFVENETLLYYNEAEGSINQVTLPSQISTPILDSIPSPRDTFEFFSQNNLIDQRSITFDSPLQVQFASNQKRFLIYALNESFDIGTESYPFWNSEVQQEALWWIYDINEQRATPLSARFTSVGWYSDTEIIYVFDDREVAVAPINDLGNFRVLTDQVPASSTPNKPIIASRERQLIPLQDGYLIGNRGEFTMYRTSGEAQALASQDTFLIHTATDITILDWNGTVITTLKNLRPLAKALLTSSDSILLLFESGEILLYSFDGTIQQTDILQDFVDDIMFADMNTPSQVLLIQSGNVVVYDVTQNQIDSVIQDDPESPLDITSNTQRLQRTTTTSVSQILFIGGGVIIVGLIGLGLFIWKKRKS